MNHNAKAKYSVGVWWWECPCGSGSLDGWSNRVWGPSRARTKAKQGASAHERYVHEKELLESAEEGLIVKDADHPEPAA